VVRQQVVLGEGGCLPQILTRLVEHSKGVLRDEPFQPTLADKDSPCRLAERSAPGEGEGFS